MTPRAPNWGDHLQHVGATPHAAVEDDGNPPGHPLCDAGQDVSPISPQFDAKKSRLTPRGGGTMGLSGFHWGHGVARLTALLLVALLSSTEPFYADEITDLDTRAFASQQTGKTSDGIDLAKQALALAIRLHGPQSARAATQANNLGLLYSLAGRHSEAELLFRQAIQLRTALFGKDAPQQRSELRNLAWTLEDERKHEEAEQTFRRVRDILRQATGSNPADLVQADQELAETIAKAGRRGEAVTLLKEALDTDGARPGTEDKHLVPLLDALVRLLIEMGSAKEAEPYAVRNLAIHEHVYGEDHAETADRMASLARVYLRLARFGEADGLNLRALAIKQKALGPNSLGVAATLNDLAVSYKQQSRLDEAEQTFLRSLTIREKLLGADNPDVALTLNNLAGVYERQGRFGDAEVAAKRSLAIAENAPGSADPMALIRPLTTLGIVFSKQERYDVAGPLLVRALDLSEKAFGPNHPDVAVGLNNLAILRHQMGDTASAERLHRRALAIRERVLGSQHPATIESVSSLAALLTEQDRFAEAEPLMKRALKAEAALNANNPLLAVEYNNLGQLQMRMGRHDEAEKSFAASLQVLSTSVARDHPYVSATLRNIGSSRFLRQHWAGAVEAISASAEIAIHRITRQGSILGRSLTGKGEDEIADNRNTFEFLVKALYRLAFEPQANANEITGRSFEAAQRVTGSRTAASLAQMAARFSSADPALASLVRQRQDLVSEWSAAETAQMAAAGSSAEVGSEGILQARLDRIAAQVAAIDEHLQISFPTYAAFVKPEPVHIDQLQQLMTPDEVLLYYLDTKAWAPAPAQTFVWVVSKDKAVFGALKVTPDELAHEVHVLRRALGVDGPVRGAVGLKTNGKTDAAIASANRLYGMLLGLVEDDIQGKELLIVPSESIASLPFHLLVAEMPPANIAPSERNARADWLVRRYAISVLPTVASLQALRREGPPKANTTAYLGIGDPLLTGKNGLDRRAWAAQTCASSHSIVPAIGNGDEAPRFSVLFRNGYADVSAVRNLEPLPETTGEVCAVAEALGADAASLLLGSTATESKLKGLSAAGELAKARVVHFATHGLVSGDLEGQAEPSLVLTPPEHPTEADDGLLTASEVAALHMNADWVILSACNTAAGDTANPETLSGLTRAFFYAGARAVLVSHWPVNSNAAVALTTRTFKALGADHTISRSEAFRRAMVSMIDEGGPASDPAYWAPFVLVGDGRSQNRM